MFPVLVSVVGIFGSGTHCDMLKATRCLGAEGLFPGSASERFMYRRAREGRFVVPPLTLS